MGKILVPIPNKLAVPFHDLLYEKLKNVKRIQKSGWDCCFVVCGDERAGKSTLGITMGYILSGGTLTCDNIAPHTAALMEKLRDMPDESVAIVDEGSLMFSSKDAMAKEQKQLIKILNVIGQKRMILIIILPDFFDLTKYLAVHRSRFLVRVYADKQMRRGRFMYWGEKRKKILYEYGKKHFGSYAFPKSNFKGTFNDFNPLGAEYQKLKNSSLWAALRGEDEVHGDSKFKLQRDVLINHVYRKRWMKQLELEKFFEEHGCIITRSNISRVCGDVAKKGEKLQ